MAYRKNKVIRRKQISAREKDFARVLAETGLGAVEAYRKIFSVRCETKQDQQKARDLARQPRIRDEVQRLKVKYKKEAEAEQFMSTVGFVDLERMHDYIIKQLFTIRDSPDVKSQTRFNALKLLEKMYDPSGDQSLIFRWIDYAWRYQKAHCPCCHKSFPLAKIHNKELQKWRDKVTVDPIVIPENDEDDYTRRLQLIKQADPRNTPHTSQIKALSAKERHIVGKGAARAGKVLAPNTSILTAKGWKLYKDLRLGDTLFDEKGKPCNIVAFSPVWNEGDWYKVKFDTGVEIVAHENHEWETYTYYNRVERGQKKSSSVVTTREIKETLKVRNGSHNNHAILVSGPVEFSRQEVPLDPYILGCWLGDGTSSNSSMTIGLEDYSHFDKEFSNRGFKLLKRSNKISFGIVDVRNKNRLYKGPSAYCFSNTLEKLGVLNNKYIPDVYLYGSIDQRLSVLQGLMDTDGTIDKKGRCEFSNSNLNLVCGVKFLLRSLGVKVADERRRIVRCNGKPFESYRLNFSANLPVFRMSRKLNRVKKNYKWTKYHYITSVEKVESEVGRCIEVDSPSNLYLAGESLIPTHNSYLLSLFAILAFLLPGVEIWVLARIYEDARSEVEYIKHFLNILFYPHMDLMVTEYYDKRTGELNLVSKWGSELRVRSAKAKGSITGRALEVALVAEPGWVEGDIFEELRARMSERLGRIIALGTPKGTSGFIGRMVRTYGRDPKTGRFVRRQPHERLISSGCPWNISMLEYRINPVDNPAYVRSEQEAARQELTDVEYASEFEGLMATVEGAKFGNVLESHLQNIPRSFFEEAEFVLGIDQGQTNFGSCLVAYDGNLIVPCWEYFNSSDTDSMQRNLMKLRDRVPLWIRKLGGDPNKWKLTIVDLDPPLHGDFQDLEDRGAKWPTDITFRHRNNIRYQQNWRRECQEFVNNMAMRNRLMWHLSDEYSVDTDESPGTGLLHDQVRNALDVTPNPEAESKSDNKKGWEINDPWRGDHVVDAWYLAMWTIFNSEFQVSSVEDRKNEDDVWAEHKAGFEYSLAARERQELMGFRDDREMSDNRALFKKHFRRSNHFIGIPPGNYGDES